MAIAMDESVRDILVANSPYFARFVILFQISKSLYIQDMEKQKYFK